DLAGRLQVLGSGGEVQKRRSSAEGVQAEQGHRDGLDVRQQDADDFSIPRQTRELASQDERPENQSPECDGLTLEILQRDLVPPEKVPGVEKRFEQALARPRR